MNMIKAYSLAEDLLAKQYKDTFNLKRELKLTFTYSVKKPALYCNKLNEDYEAYHKIKIPMFYCANEKALQETLLHELIHAWQDENGKNVGHGKSFKKWVKFFKENYGLNVE